MTDTKEYAGDVFPVYVLVDTSASMSLDGKIQAANDIVPSLIDACKEYNSLADNLRFSLVSFNNTANTVVPMSTYDKAAIVNLIATGGTSYSAGFDEVRKNIDTDIAQLKSDDYKVYRPSVFFITDGEPTDSAAQRDSAWNDLTDKSRRTHPNVVTFGVGNEISRQTLQNYKSHNGKVFFSKSGSDAAKDIKTIIEILVMSVVASSNAATAGGSGGLQLDLSRIDEENDELM